MISTAIIIGRLGKDPELRFTPTGKAVTNLSVACDVGFGTHKQTVWHNVVVWGKAAEATSKHCKKGRLLYIEGDLVSKKFTDKNGVDREKMEIISQKIDFLGESKATGDGVGEDDYSQDNGDYDPRSGL